MLMWLRPSLQSVSGGKFSHSWPFETCKFWKSHCFTELQTAETVGKWKVLFSLLSIEMIMTETKVSYVNLQATLWGKTVNHSNFLIKSLVKITVVSQSDTILSLNLKFRQTFYVELLLSGWISDIKSGTYAERLVYFPEWFTLATNFTPQSKVRSLFPFLSSPLLDHTVLSGCSKDLMHGIINSSPSTALKCWFVVFCWTPKQKH